MASRTVLVGEVMEDLQRMIVMIVMTDDAPAEDSDDEGVGDDGDEHEAGHHPPVHRLHDLQRPQPRARIHDVAAALRSAPAQNIFTETKYFCPDFRI